MARAAHPAATVARGLRSAEQAAKLPMEHATLVREVSQRMDIAGPRTVRPALDLVLVTAAPVLVAVEIRGSTVARAGKFTPFLVPPFVLHSRLQSRF